MAFGTGVLEHLGFLFGQAFPETAVRVAGTGFEPPETPALDDQVLAALGTNSLCRNPCFLNPLDNVGLLEISVQEGMILLQALQSVRLPVADPVQLFLHAGRELDIHEVGEMPDQKLHDE